MKLRYAFPILAVLVVQAPIPAQKSTMRQPEDKQSLHEKVAPVPSTSLMVTSLSGAAKRWSLAEFKALPHVTVAVHNAHTNQDERYSGVNVQSLLDDLGGSQAGGHKGSSTNMQIIIAGATDDFHVAITMCDVNPDCRNGQAIVADSVNGVELGKEGAFKLILTEDKKPARWARNLNSLSVKVVEAP